jgi:hypothetical protein
MSEAFSDLLVQTSQRTKERFDKALKKIKDAKYGPEDWVSDVFGFWLDDVLGPLMAGAPTGTTLLLTKNNRRSREVSVTNPLKVVLTNLKRVGGGNPKEIDASNGNHILKVTPTSPGTPTPPGTVAVEVMPALDSQVTAGEHYAGLLYEDQKLLAQVIFVALP